MEYFKKYHSNTLAGSGNQHFFINEKGVTTACMLYKLTEGGNFSYSFLFSNIIDSTYSNGKVSHKNLVLDSWEIHSLRVGITDFCDENGFIKNSLSGADFIFDCAQFLADKNGDPIYGGHPNAQGCKLWGEALFKALKEVI